MNAVWAWDPFDGNGPYSWNVSGGYSVTATAVPAPFEVTENGPDASGAVTYAAEALYGLQFRNPSEAPVSWPAGALFWTFFPGDSLSDRPDLSGAGWEISACQFQLVCRYTPPGPGRMQVRAYVEERAADVRSGPAGRCQVTPGSGPLGTRAASLSVSVDGCEPPKLSLTCNMRADSVTVQRAGDIDCRAEASPQGAQITWTFVADSFPYQNPDTGSTAHTGASWQGKMVLSGTITVRATIQAQPFEAKMHVHVEPRNWTGKEFDADVAEQAAEAGEFTARPDSVRQLGHIHHEAVFQLDPGYWQPILTGPNSLLGYLVKVPVKYRGHVHVNRLALSNGSDFWTAQREHMPHLSPGDFIPCLRSDVEPFVQIVLRHEGVGLDPKSHAYLWLEEGKRDFGPAAEPIVGTSARDILNRATEALEPMAEKADSASAWADSTGYAPSTCTFTYRYPRVSP